MNENIIRTILAVANTLDAITIRADQIDAIQRINACSRELHAMLEAFRTQPDEGKEHKDE